MRNKIFGVILALFVGMMILSFKFQPVRSEPRTWIVDDDGPADFHTIQGAINASASGDTVYVKVGKYLEHIEIRKSIKLLGEDRDNTFIYTTGIQKFWGLIEARTTTNVTIFGFTVKDHEYGMGIFMVNCRDCNISHNILLNHQFGIDIRRSENNFIIDNEISGCDIYGIVISENSKNNVLRENNLTGNDLNLGIFGSFVHDIDTSNVVDGKTTYYWVNQKDKIVPSDAGYVALIDSKNIVIESLTITHNQGVLLVNTTNSKILNLNVSDSLWGIQLVLSSSNVMSGCTLIKNDNGIRMDNSNQNNITGNTVSYNSNGIALYTSNENIIFNNAITIDWDYSYSFKISHAARNFIYHNNIIHRHGRGVFMSISSSNNWDNGVEGNYWSDYNGTDIDGDCIGDTPYRIDALNVDRCPLVNIWMGAPDTVPPIADAGNNQTVAVNITVHFNAIDSYDNVGIVSYEWNFGDGNTGIAVATNHTYSGIGNYTVTLTVRDAKNNRNSTSIIVEVLTDTDGDGIADEFDNDDDNDGMPDEWEIENGLNPLDSLDASQDSDSDWFSNIEEHQWGMNPRIFNPWKIYLAATIIVAASAVSVTIIIALKLLRKSKTNAATLNETSKI